MSYLCNALTYQRIDETIPFVQPVYLAESHKKRNHVGLGVEKPAARSAPFLIVLS